MYTPLHLELKSGVNQVQQKETAEPLLWKQHPNLFACSQSSVHREATVGGSYELEMQAVNIKWSATYSLPCLPPASLPLSV